jgi:hypothetical protein
MHRFLQEGVVLFPRLILGFAELPLAHEQRLQIQIPEHLLQGNVIGIENAGAPEGGSGRGMAMSTASERRVYL